MALSLICKNPTGYLSYSADDRIVALYDTMFSYAGTYSVETDKIIHHVDISWNESWTGTDQIRLFEASGNTLPCRDFFFLRALTQRRTPRSMGKLPSEIQTDS
jgi:hypothetical protein